MSPLLLMLMVALAAGTFVFLQVGHASVLATDAETAADAAALAGAENMRTQVHNMANHNPVDTGEVCVAARDYAQRNDASLTGCRVSLSEFALTVSIRGDVPLMDGSLDDVDADRPVRRAKAGVTLQNGTAVAVKLLPLGQANDPWGSGVRIPDAGPGVGPPGAASGGLILPVAGPITSPYGMRVHPVTGVTKMHTGTDFGVACGTPIRAAASGTITNQYFSPGYGNRVVIDHGTINGQRIVTTYNHLSSFARGPGATIEQGQVLGSVGTTGLSTGCHLHWELLANGSTTDPMNWAG